MATRIEGDQHFANNVVIAGTLTAPAGSITNNNILASAGIVTSKLDHLFIMPYFKVGTVATETAGIYVARKAGTVKSVEAFMIGANASGATVTVNVLKNGTTILSANASFSDSDAARAVKTGTISSAAYVDGDVFEVVVTATAGGGTVGTGLHVGVEFDEASV